MLAVGVLDEVVVGGEGRGAPPRGIGPPTSSASRAAAI